MITKTYTYKGYEIQRKRVVEFDGTKWIPTKQYEIYSCGYMIPMITDTLKEAKAEINRRIEMFGNKLITKFKC